jgi:hypothetical protein
MYADSTPVVAHAPSCTRRSWPPAPAQREPITIEPDPDGNNAPVNVVPVPRHRRPLIVRTYITPDGVVRETDEPKRRAHVPPLSPDRADAPPMRRWAEELDEVGA